MKNLIEVRNFAEQTEYKSEITRTACTVWFHEGNGHNFEVKRTAKYTYITRYYTNGSSNRVIQTKKLTGVAFPKSWEDARELFENIQ